MYSSKAVLTKNPRLGRTVLAHAFAFLLLSMPMQARATAASNRIVLVDSVTTTCYDVSGLPCRKLSRTLRGLSTTRARQRLQNMLDSLGYFQARWDTTSGSISCDPGCRSVVYAATVHGDSLVDTVAPSFGRLPRPYDAAEVAAYALEISRSLARRGHPFANIKVGLRRGASNETCRDSVHVTYTVEPDVSCRFGPPSITGATSTSARLIYRDIMIREGDLFNLSVIEETERRLRSRPYIEKVVVGDPLIAPASDSAVMDDSGRGQPRVVIPITLTDRTGMGLDGVVGLQSTRDDRPSFQGNLVVSFLNLFRAGESASLLYEGNQELQRMQMGIAKPWLLGLPITAGTDFGLEIERRRYGYLHGRISALAEIGPSWQVGTSILASETTPDSTGEPWQFYGVDLMLGRAQQPYRDGVFVNELRIESGSGVAHRDRLNTRSHIEFSTGAHVPLPGHLAVAGRLFSNHLITKEVELAPAEMYRTGGYRSIRGYSDGEFSFRTVLFGQFENLYYFSPRGSVYIFADGGIGFQREIGPASDYTRLLGYGLGLRLPARAGTINLELARNLHDRRSLGRIHLRIQNAFSSDVGLLW